MATTNIARIAPLPVPVPLNPTPGLPAWALELHAAVFTHEQLDESGRWIDPLVLRTMPTAEQRLGLERHAQHLHELLDQIPLNDDAFAKRTFGLVSKLLLAKPGRAGGLEAVKAKIEAYEIALDDVPSWAVQISIRKWLRGECDQRFASPPEIHDYVWAPEGAILRKIALRVVYTVKDRLRQIERILSAVPFRNDEPIRRRNCAAIVAALAGKVEPGTPIDQAAEIGRLMIESKNRWASVIDEVPQ